MLSKFYPKYVNHKEDGRRVVVQSPEHEFDVTGIEVDEEGNPVNPPAEEAAAEEAAAEEAAAEEAAAEQAEPVKEEDIF